jgi:hypothetical protein
VDTNPKGKPMSERLDGFAEGWRPEPEDKLIGDVVELAENDGGFGEYPVVAVLTDDGDEKAVHGFHTVLRGELAKQQPAVGDRIGIAYHGKVKGKNGTEYESYRVIVEPAEPKPAVTPDWDKHASEARAELGGDQPPHGDEPPADDDGPW